MYDSTPTGETRLRAQRVGLPFFKRTVLVLQVRGTWTEGPSDSHGMPIYLAGSGWRDARVEDLALINQPIGFKHD